MASPLNNLENGIELSSSHTSRSLSETQESSKHSKPIKCSSLKNITVQGKDLSREAFYVQAILIYIICVTCIVNLSLGSEHSDVFISLLSGSLGVLLPSPRILRPKKSAFYDLPKDSRSDIS